MRALCTKFVQDHTHGLGGRDYAFPSHMQALWGAFHRAVGVVVAPLVRPSSCNVKGGTPSSRRCLPTYLPTLGVVWEGVPTRAMCMCFSLCCDLDGKGCTLVCTLHKQSECLREAFGLCHHMLGKAQP